MPVRGLTEEEYQRLVLANQYEIMTRLAPDEPEWGRALDWVVRGFPLDEAPYLDSIRDGINDPVTDAELKMVQDALELYLRLQIALEGQADEAIARFPGFDGNNEGGALSYMRLLRESGRWTHVKPEGDQGINSHHPTYAMYRRQIDRWNQLGRPNDIEPDVAREIIGL